MADYLIISASIMAVLVSLVLYSAHKVPDCERMWAEYYWREYERLQEMHYHPREKSLSYVADDGLHLNMNLKEAGNE